MTEYRRSYAKAIIAKAIGTCELLVRFNNREKLKQSNQPHALDEEHHHLLAKLQTMVLRTWSEKKHAKLKDLEKNPYKQHNCLPKENTEYAYLFEITTIASSY